MIRRARRFLAGLVVVGLAGCGKDDGPPPPVGGNPPASPGPAVPDDVEKGADAAIRRGKTFLLSQRDEATGAFDESGQIPVGYSAIAALALVAATPRGGVATDPAIEKTLAFVVAAQREDGSIGRNPQFVNYETSVAVSALAAARIGKFRDAQDRAVEFLRKSQVGGDEKDLNFGGFPYRSQRDPSRPTDLSNAQFAAAAAHDAGLTDAEFWRRLRVYLDKVQNRSETNATSVRRKEGDSDVEVVSGNDGGAAYGPGFSMAGLVKRADGKFEPRSYGSMTYALLKCWAFAGLKPDDPRMAAAIGWISRNFTVDRNPGFETGEDPAKKGQQGYFYYLTTMARALAEVERVTGKPFVVKDADGQEHAWRREVIAKLVSLQRSDGSWLNPVDRWEEASPILVTSYAVQTLALAQGRLP